MFLFISVQMVLECLLYKKTPFDNCKCTAATVKERCTCMDPDVCLSQFQRAGPVSVLGSGWSPSPVEIGQRICIRGLPDLLQQSPRSAPSSSSAPSSPALSPLTPSDRVPSLAEVHGAVEPQASASLLF